MVQLALRSTKFYMHESCGKCTPCREGTRWIVQLLERIEAGDATMDDLDLLRKVCDRIEGKSLCALGDFAVWPVQSYFDKWHDEWVAHVEQGGCPFGGESSLEGSSRRPTSTPTCPSRRCRRERAGARHGHDRRPRGAGAEGPRARRGRARRGNRDPGLLLRAAARIADRRLPHVPGRGRGDPEAPDRLHHDRCRRDEGAHRADLAEGGRRPGRDARVHPRQPPARLPGLRQGRRVPAAGPDLPLGPGQHADAVRQADAREADPGLADDRARPRALHPLLPLHALLRERRRGQSARRAEPRRVVGDRHLRGPALPRALLRQRDRALPGRRADLDAVPLRGSAVGDPERADRLRALPGRLQRRRDDARGQGQAHALAEPPGVDEGWLLRQGPLRLHAPVRRRPDHRSRCGGGARAVSRRSPGTTRSTRRSACCASRAGGS
mgnify:CR=1 FL=1